MNVFIAWSGRRSKFIAETIHEWLSRVIQAVEPWMSSENIEAGMVWPTELFESLEKGNVGIVCLTPENLDAPWLSFESGAIAKVVGKSRLIPLLYDLEISDLTPPFSLFTAKKLDYDGVGDVVASINNALGEKSLDQSRLVQSFEQWWPKFQADLEDIPEVRESQAQRRTGKDMIEEILLLVRTLVSGTEEEPPHTPTMDPERYSAISYGVGQNRPLIFDSDTGTIREGAWVMTDKNADYFSLGGPGGPVIQQPDATDEDVPDDTSREEIDELFAQENDEDQDVEEDQDDNEKD